MRRVLSTPRLDLAVFTLEDAAGLHALFSDPATHTIGSGAVTDLGRTRAWIERRVDVHARLGLAWYALRARGEDTVIGNCGLFAGRTGEDEPEIGYEVQRASRGGGLAAEAAAAVLAEARASGVPRVWATIRPANGASLAIARRFGLVHDRDERDDRGELAFFRSGWLQEQLPG